MRKNYKAWSVNTGDFYKLKNEKERLRFLINYTILAPSTHNTQPWDFYVERDFVVINANYGRSLPKSDKGNRFLIFSIGCAVENLLIAADFFNYKTKVKKKINSEKTSIKVILRRSLPPRSVRSKKIHLIYSIPKRFTDRGFYNNGKVNKKKLSRLESIKNNLVSTIFVSDNTTKKKLQEILLDAEKHSFSSKDFTNELSQYLKHTFTRSPLGMPGNLFGFNPLLSFFVPTLLRKINFSDVVVNKQKPILASTPVFGLHISKKDSLNDWLSAGQKFERLWLQAVSEGLRVQPLASAVSRDKYSQEIKRLLSIKGYLNMIFRLGHSDKGVLHSPRFSSDRLFA